MQNIFDLDDTLYLERDYVRSGFKAVDHWLSSNYGLSNFFESAWNHFESGMRGNIFNLVLAENNVLEDGLVQQLVARYRDHDPQIFILPDAEQFLSQFKKSELAIITDGFSGSQWRKIKALKLEKLVSRIIVTGDWGRTFWKPNPRAFVAVMGDHSPKSCRYFGDNPIKDFIAPSQLGWAPSVRIRRIGSLHFDLQSPKTCIEMSTFDGLIL